MSDLSFATLRKANVLRLPMFKNSKGETAHAAPDGSDWTIQEWINAMLGELGETANLLKKVRRADMTMQQAFPEIKKEFADIIVYFDLMLHRIRMPLLFQWQENGETFAVSSFGQFASIHSKLLAEKLAEGHKITKTPGELLTGALPALGKMVELVQQLDGLALLQVEKPDLAESLTISMTELVKQLQNNAVSFFCSVCTAAIECNVDLAEAVREKFNRVSVRVGADVFIHEDDIVVNRDGCEIITSGDDPTQKHPQGVQLQ